MSFNPATPDHVRLRLRVQDEAREAGLSSKLPKQFISIGVTFDPNDQSVHTSATFDHTEWPKEVRDIVNALINVTNREITRVLSKEIRSKR
jgi:hypothetical protein